MPNICFVSLEPFVMWTIIPITKQTYTINNPTASMANNFCLYFIVFVDVCIVHLFDSPTVLCIIWYMWIGCCHTWVAIKIDTVWKRWKMMEHNATYHFVYKSDGTGTSIGQKNCGNEKGKSILAPNIRTIANKSKWILFVSFPLPFHCPFCPLVSLSHFLCVYFYQYRAPSCVYCLILYYRRMRCICSVYTMYRWTSK